MRPESCQNALTLRVHWQGFDQIVYILTFWFNILINICRLLNFLWWWPATQSCVVHSHICGSHSRTRIAFVAAVSMRMRSYWPFWQLRHARLAVGWPLVGSKPPTVTWRPMHEKEMPANGSEPLCARSTGLQYPTWCLNRSKTLWTRAGMAVLSPN